MAGEEVTVTLRGESAQLGAVQARDVARLLLDLEGALAAAAYVALGKPRRSSTGRHVAAVEAATRLHFRQVRSGSVVAVLGLPTLAEESSEAFDVGIDDLAGAAFDQLVLAFNSADSEVDPGVARALADLAEDVGIGDRNTEVVIESTRRTHSHHASVRLDASGRARMRRIAQMPMTPSQQPNVLTGTLREADLDRHTARLHTPTGETVSVTFPPELESQIHEAMRGLSNFEGVVTYNPLTSHAKSVAVRAITAPELLGGDDFWAAVPSVAQLASEQGVEVPELDGPAMTTSQTERDELLAALADLRA